MLGRKVGVNRQILKVGLTFQSLACIILAVDNSPSLERCCDRGRTGCRSATEARQAMMQISEPIVVVNNSGDA